MERDDELMVSLANGDQSAMTALIDIHERQLLRWVGRMIFCRQTAEDICQEAFTKVYLQCETYEPRGRFTCWLHAITRNLVIDHNRRPQNRLMKQAVRVVVNRQGNQSSVVDQLQCRRRKPVDEVETKDLVEKYRPRIQQLPKPQLHVIHAVADGWTLPEIAEWSREPIATIKGRLRLLRKRIINLKEISNGNETALHARDAAIDGREYAPEDYESACTRVAR